VLDSLHEMTEHALEMYDSNELESAVALTTKAENVANSLEDETDRVTGRYYVSLALIDVGAELKDESMIRRAIEYLKVWIHGDYSIDLPNDLFNLANGYYALLSLDPPGSFLDVDTENHQLARRLYRMATSGMTQEHAARGTASTAWTNYGNLLDVVGRNVEALSAYDEALILKPDLGMALGNKGVALRYFAVVMPGYSHLLYHESIRALEAAIQQQDLPELARLKFVRALDHINDIVKHHQQSNTPMDREQYEGIQPKDDFQAFLCQFCAANNLFLSPVSRVGKEETYFYGDPLHLLFMSGRTGDNRLNKYIWFLNEIKQEYVLGRYFLVQSQYESAVIDAVDEGVTLVQPEFGFPVFFGTNIQLLQSALRQAVAVLDKVAYFLYDYCKLNTKPDRISFLKIWGDLGTGTIQKGFKNYKCGHLFALFTLARDLYRDGDWNTLIEDRGVVTHRFIILHDSQDETESVGDIPARHLSDFLANTVFALQIARAAVMYLIMFFNHFEYWKPIHKK